ncbi:hypothetical protein E4T91_01375 [Ligilactobacillus murinus]|uniref:hypothetical protein n=1 Tax=Ligilactobacillus murinus TaxID=1622 RepID=UPI0010717476|nr:hypothetical protein [Ligilactobacillus murinus]MBF0757415.1 hypothetical protein [Ligilactobacillus murinus]MBF0832797.1 hypothetical protein [Ligilactobacillus murinus]TFU66569.1 hypothetical protein E4T91_01375 [Ligilactobacillus murinus]
MTNLVYQLLFETKTGLRLCKLWKETVDALNSYIAYCSKNKVVGVVSYLVTVIVGAVLLKLWIIPFVVKILTIGAYILGGLVFCAIFGVILLLNLLTKYL